MESKQLNTKLLEYVPELKNLFESVTCWQEGLETGSTIVIDDVFMVYLKEALKTNNKIALKKCSDFIEWLTDYYDDEYAGDVLVICIFEHVHFSEDKDKLETVFGPKAKSKYLAIDWNK